MLQCFIDNHKVLIELPEATEMKDGFISTYSVVYSECVVDLAGNDAALVILGEVLDDVDFQVS